MNDPGQQRKQASFFRDVAVNVLANLVAAAIIYLGGVLFGLFPRSPSAIATAAAFVLMFAFFATVVASRFMGESRRTKAAAVASVMFGSAFLIGGLANLELEPLLPRWGHIALGAYAMITGLAYLVSGWLRRNRR